MPARDFSKCRLSRPETSSHSITHRQGEKQLATRRQPKKNHLNVDRKHKLVRRGHVTDAAVHDSQAVDELLTRTNTAWDV